MMYNEIMENLRLVQIELLDELNRICKKFNIRYQLFAGTLLGAVRHKGFIPWDDDIDICMLRNDYIKFIEIAPKVLNEKFYLDEPDSSNSVVPFAKLRKRNTLQFEGCKHKYAIHQGIFIDIFQMDNVFPNTISGEIQRFKLNHLHRVRAAKINVDHKSSFKKIVKKIYNYLYRKNYHYYVKKIDKLSMKYNNYETEYVALLTSITTKKKYSGFIYKRSDFDNSIQLEFEGKCYPAPKRYHELLTLEYGDYMTPPPKELQKPHHGVVKINFGGETFDIYEDQGELKARKGEPYKND